MLIHQFEYKGLAQYSYLVLSGGQAALIDPGRDPAPYYEFLRRHQGKITAVLETHSHADFVSSHREIAETTGAKIYASEFMKAAFPVQPVTDGDIIAVGEVQLKVLYTPGHSFDSVCFLLLDETGREHALFSGDTLFIGDLGRPDLRESVQDEPARREELARAMFRTVTAKLQPLPDEVILYPGHGAGTLCGKSLSEANSSTMGAEKAGNYAFSIKTEDAFIKSLLDDQPFMPKYFSYDVTLNQQGAPNLQLALETVPRHNAQSLPPDFPDREALVIDTRPSAKFRENHWKGSFNIPDGLKFETWLGSVVGPDERFYLLAGSEEETENLLRKAAKIGYERNIIAAINGIGDNLERHHATLPIDFDSARDQYTIIDARNRSEFAAGAYFPEAINIPLPELRERAGSIPTAKPLVVHCAAGYRSGIAASILNALVPQQVYDMGNAIERRKNGS